jgi:hypothetical protein
MSNRKLPDLNEQSSPLALWRSAPAETLTSRDANRVRRALRAFQIFGEPTWNDAIRGDAAAAVGIAIRIAVKSPCIEPIVDLVMGPVLTAAFEGDAAARTFISHMLLKRAATDAAAQSLATSWIEVNRAVDRSGGATRAEPHMRRPRNRQVMSSVASRCRR